jgi:riboflavin synthase alpha subunit
MFTGIVEEVGQVRSVESTTNGRRLAINAATVLDGLAPGDSIAVDGVCQTVVSLDDGAFTVESVATTLSRTTLGGLGAGDPVNLERALALGARLGGHFVQGHVDAVGTVLSIVHDGDHVLLDVQVPELVAEVTVLHGSIAIHGVSLTVNALPAENRVQAALIPHTFDRVEDAIADIRAGRLVIVADDEDRENEGDLVCAAACITPELVNFMATHGRGLICVALTEERAEALDLTPMTERNTGSWAPRSRSRWMRHPASA